jgi:dihydrofolate reductase
MEIVLIVAVAENGVIGRDNAIPWRLKSDQQRLKAITAAPAASGTDQHRRDA